MKKKKYLLLISIAFLMLTLSGCSEKKDEVSKTGFYFNTAIKITLYNSEEKNIDDCFEMCREFENKFSNTIESSEISQINLNSSMGNFTSVSDETIELIKYGIHYGDVSDGKFDITIGKLSDEWNFSGDNPSVPEDSIIKEAVSHINYKDIVINGNEVKLTDENSSIDLGGIAKGYIADKIKEFLLDKGVKKGIINLGGNVLLIGSRRDNSNYNIGIQKPFGSDDDVITIINSNDMSIVTSGVYERYFYEGDILYHHILNTDTGYPVNNELLSVTIISKKSVDGDGLSTSCFALGLDDGMKLIEDTENTEAVFIDEDYNIHLSSGLLLKDNVVHQKSR